LSTLTPLYFLFFLYFSADHRHLHSFPTRRSSDLVIVIAVHANPDGMQMVSKCYMQNADPAQRRTCSPRLYNKYAGHDNNRDFYRSEEHTSELQSQSNLVCRLLLEKKK